jgi:hypothetical protein
MPNGWHGFVPKVAGMGKLVPAVQLGNLTHFFVCESHGAFFFMSAEDQI